VLLVKYTAVSLAEAPAQLFVADAEVQDDSKIPSRRKETTMIICLFFIALIPLFLWDEAHYNLKLKGHGTGSNPPGLNGLHRSTLQTAIKVPFITPYLYIA